jgi:hypothetical protein
MEPGAGGIVAPTSGTSPGTTPTGGGSGVDPTIGIGLAVLASLGGLLLVAATRRRRAADSQAPSAEPFDEAPLETPAEPIRYFLPPAATEPTGEEHVPRWRRPSVTAARFETDTSVAVRAASAASIPPARTPRLFLERIDEVVERMVVRYDSVLLLDRPDEALGRTQEVLDRGDEVGVLDRDEVWANVTTPTGLAGWIPAMALAVPPPVTSAENLAPSVGFEGESGSAPDDRLALETLLAAIAAARQEEQGPPISAGNRDEPAGPSEATGGHSTSSARRRRKRRSATRPN